MSRIMWFAAGAGAGVYGILKARRAAEAFTPEGLTDRLSALALGVQLFGEEVRTGMTEKETELRERLDSALHGTPGLPELSASREAVGNPAGGTAHATAQATAQATETREGDS